MVFLLLLLIYVSFVGLGLPDALLGTAWPVMQQTLSVPGELAGLCAFQVSLFTVFSSLSTSRALARFGTGRVTMGSILCTAVAVFGYAMAQNFYTLLPFAVLLGLGAGAVDAALSNYVALYFQAKHMNWLHGCWGIGAMTGPVVMSFCLQNGHWQYGFWVVGGLLLLIVLVLLFTQRLWAIFEKPGQVLAEEEAKLVTNREAVRIPGVKSAMLAMFCYNGCETAMGLWMATYLVQGKALQPEQAAGVCALLYIGILAGRLLAGFLTEKIPEQHLIRFGTVLGILGLLCLLAAPNAIMAAAGLLLLGLGGAPIYPCVVHQTPARFGQRASATVVGLELASAYVGSTLVPSLTGVVMGFAGAAAIPGVVLVLYVVLLAAVLVGKNAKPLNKIKE